MISRAVTITLIVLLAIPSAFDSPAGRVSSSDDLIKVEVANLILDDQNRNVVLLLKADAASAQADAKAASLVLPLVIGLEEANSIGVVFHKITVPRPLSHDLMKKIIEEYGGSVVSCTITKMERATFFAELRLKRAGREVVIDCRPSDAIGLALRSGAPVYVRRAVILEHGVAPSKSDPASKPLKT